MLTDKCKKQLKELLKERYNIDCHRIVQAQENAYNYFYFTLICVCENKGFEMLLTISRHMRYPTVLRTNVVFGTIQSDIEADEFIDDYDFTIQIDSKNTDLVRSLSDRMYDNPIVSSMNTINKQFSLGIDSKYYMLYTKIIPIVGMMTKDKGWFNIKTISETPYFVGNLCSSFVHPKRAAPANEVLFNFFIFGEQFNYVTGIKATSSAYNTESLLPINPDTLKCFEKDAFQEIFFTYSKLFDFKIEDMSKEELRELDIDDFLKYIEVQKMAEI